jgi:hypothetical protein
MTSKRQSFSDQQIGSIVFNETRSLSGPNIRQARINLAHAILNAADSPHRFPLMASHVATPGSGEGGIYASCFDAASTARLNVMSGIDPTGGATHFNFRPNKSTSPFQGHALRTSVGPLENSYPTDDLPSDGIYANTYT